MARAIMGFVPRARRSPGSRTALDVLRGLLRPPDPDAVTTLVAEMETGCLAVQPVEVSCFLRGAGDALPRRWRQGLLTLDGRTLTWQARVGHRGEARRLPSRLDVEQVREVEGADRLKIKHGLFKIIVCQATSGRVELAVPSLDIPLVRRAIQRDQKASEP
ncbi:DUF2550 family protein [Frankia sp. QA3]|uniref:DUF2550 family protein n=1 Tax=Frankia sp. QA3 TaxID=710111 RepID=UPI001E4A8B1D|nr:DUF2550 family protein [Frankia sp. QA3]